MMLATVQIVETVELEPQHKTCLDSFRHCCLLVLRTVSRLERDALSYETANALARSLEKSRATSLPLSELAIANAQLHLRSYILIAALVVDFESMLDLPLSAYFVALSTIAP